VRRLPVRALYDRAEALGSQGECREAIRPAERFPDLSQVLDHAGKPPIADGDLADRGRQARLLVAHPHVVCKVSRLITEADHGRWTVDDIRPRIALPARGGVGPAAYGPGLSPARSARTRQAAHLRWGCEAFAMGSPTSERRTRSSVERP
jgi:hypothetical protein